MKSPIVIYYNSTPTEKKNIRNRKKVIYNVTDLMFFLGLLLFLITFVLNSLGSWVISRLRNRLLGEA